MLKNIFPSSFALFFAVFFVTTLVPLAVTAMPPSQKTEKVITGTITETMNSGGYTYMLVELSSGQSNWVAIPESAVEKGSTVDFYEGMVMEKFPSHTLDRTFETIIFSPGLANNKKESPHAAPTQPEDSFAAAVEAEKNADNSTLPVAIGGQESGGSLAAIVPFEKLDIEKVSANNGYTIEEIFSKAKILDGQQVSVRGKVLKFSPMIMGRNWIHIQDGTGNAMKNEHDLVITTQDSVEEGAIIVVDGVLAADKDFGAGYHYPVIIEDAKIIQ